MGQVSTKFTGDPQQLLQAYQQLYAANVKLQEQNANTARQSRRDRDEISSHIAGEIRGVTALGASYLTVSSAVGTVTKAYDEWRQRLADIAAKAKEGNHELVRQINLAGHAASAGLVAQQLKNIPGATGAEALAAYRGVTAGTDYKVSPERQVALVRAIAPEGAFGLSEADLESLGEFAGQLATINPQASPQRSAEKAMQIQAQAGRHFEKLRSAKVGQGIRQLVAHNIPEDYVWGLAIEAASLDSPQLITKLAAASTGPYEAPDTKGRTRLTPEEAAKLKFAAARAGEERFALLLSDPAVAQAIMPGESDVLGRLKQDAASEAGLTIMKGSYAGGEERRRALAASPAGKTVLATRENELLASAQKNAIAEIAKDYAKAEELFEGQQMSAGWAGGWWNERMRQLNRWGSFGMATPGEELTDIGNLLPSYVEQRNREAGYKRFTEGGMYTDEAKRRDAEAQAELTRQTKRLADAMEALRGAPAPVRNLNE